MRLAEITDVPTPQKGLAVPTGPADDDLYKEYFTRTTDGDHGPSPEPRPLIVQGQRLGRILNSVSGMSCSVGASLSKDVLAMNDLRCLADLAKDFHPSSFDWNAARSCGISSKLLKPASKGHTTGRILAHAISQVKALRQTLSVSLTVFKVGVTSNPPARFVSYAERGYSCMRVIVQSTSVDLIHMLEAALVEIFCGEVGCKNKPGSGGEGALNRHTAKPPYYAYVVAGRADRGRWIG